MRILIRADGGTKIGMGHIMRTSVLAESLKQFAEVIYVCRSGSQYEIGIKYIKDKGFETIEITENSVDDELTKLHADCLITDSYDVNEAYFDKMRKIFPITGYIDDLNRYYFNTDFIVNQNAYAEDLDYKVNKDTMLFLGPKYVLLRNEFRYLPEKLIHQQVENVLVTLGGSDTKNIIKVIVQEIHQAYPQINLHVVMGLSAANRSELEALNQDRIKMYYLPKISELMSKCDIAVSACGTTLYELAACGTPTIGMVIADNQRLSAGKLRELGVIMQAETVGDIINHIKRLDYDRRICMSQVARKLVDGSGSQRLASKVIDIIHNKNR